MSQFNQIEWLKTNHRLALEWSNGWTFHRILGVRPTRVDPWIYNFDLLAAGGNQSHTELKDSENKKLFDVTENYANKIMYQVGIGISPSTKKFRVYPEYPSGTQLGRILAFDPTRADQGDEWSYFTGEDSPFDYPTDAMEFVFPYKVDAMFALYNADTKKHRAKFNIMYRTCRFENLDPNVKEQADIIRKIALGTAPAKLFQIGSMIKLADYTLKPQWNIEPITFKDARKLGCG